MLKIYNIKEKMQYLDEVLSLEHEEWGSNLSGKELEDKLNKKREKVIQNLNNPKFCKLVLLNDDKLVGFISLFPEDGDEKTNLSPWYATMYVKKEYRGNGYSKILNDAILEEAKERGFVRLYLKTNLINYYEKFGAVYMKNLNNGEKLYYIDTNHQKRMNKGELIKLIETLNIDTNEFWVLSSGALVLRDLFPTAGDLDIAVTEKGLNELKSKFNLEPKGNGWYKLNDKIECVLDTKDDYKIEKFGKYYLESLEKYYEYLKSSTRPKDKVKYEIVKNYLNTK